MEEFNDNTIGIRAVKGITALISRSFFLNIISYIASLAIFTYLSPGELGIYTVIIAIQRVISFFTDFGLGAALIQKKSELKKEDTVTYFTIQIFITIFAFLTVFLSRGFISSYFKLDEVAVWLLVVLVFTIFLSSFKVIPSIQLERQIKFHRLVIPQIIESLVFNLLIIVLLVSGQGLSSYIWAFLVSSIISIPIFYYVSPWKINFAIDKESLKHLKYGIQFQVKNILATIKDDFLTIFLAKIITFNEIGYVGFGQRNAFFAYRFIVDNVTKVTFSAYSRMQDNATLLKNAIEKSLFYVSLVMFPLIFGIIIFMPFIIEHFPRWHGKWEAGLISLIFFSLNALVSSVSGILINVLDATGRVKTTLKLMVLWTVLIWILTPLLIYFIGYNGVSVASFLVTLTIFITIRLVKKVIEFDLLRSVYKPFLATVAMSLFAFLGTKFFVSDLATLMVIIFLSGLIYLINIYILAKEELHKNLKMVFVKA